MVVLEKRVSDAIGRVTGLKGRTDQGGEIHRKIMLQ